MTNGLESMADAFLRILSKHNKKSVKQSITYSLAYNILRVCN